MKILKAETTALRAFLQFNSWSEARNHGLPDHDGKAVNSLLGFARQIQVCQSLSNFNNKCYIEQLSEDSCSSLFCKNLNIVDLRSSQTKLKYDLS
ncbi:hypothetical protein [Lachnospira multipara]|uniref:hypothetical protein n=1 Tax=Lachnospira multipara TaxID=28051 RepID=UPI000CDF121A|nr:hypothetical protein [Lachnospira multipara]